MTLYSCRTSRRREAVRNSTTLNGIDYLEVIDSDAPTPADRERILQLHFLRSPPPAGIVPANVVIAGGDRIPDVRADEVHYDGDVIVIHLDRFGDFSTYRLSLVEADGSGKVLAGLDALFAAVDFSFKAELASDFDCGRKPVRSRLPEAQPEIDYLAKDYASFRQLMLDRLAVVTPGWRERNAADLGIVLVELMAAVGDYLSYRQDAAASEAYLGTARRRVSVRRHARLVDYTMHDGANARLFAHVEVGADVTLPKGAQLLTFVRGQAPRLAPDSNALAEAFAAGPEVFETMRDTPLFPVHNRLFFYTWGDEGCTLRKGATSATLKGRFPDLGAGAFLIFEEAVGPRSGRMEDADPSHRHIVRLTKVELSSDSLGGQFETPPTDDMIDVTEIEWSVEDALPFAFQLSTSLVTPQGERKLADVSIALGNVVLADHGRSIEAEDLGQVPPAPVFAAASPVAASVEGRSAATRFRPSPKMRPLTNAVPLAMTDVTSSANALVRMAADLAVPQIRLTGTTAARPPVVWMPRLDLLSGEPSGPDDPHFVVETETDGTACLRFGDNQYGLRPEPGTSFTASYRVGNGTLGNVAAEAIGHVVSDDPTIRGVRNPLPAQGGVDPESIEHVRQTAPLAFRTQERAVTAEDYAALAQTYQPQGQAEIQRAMASFRWTGSWRTVFLTIDRTGGRAVDADFENGLRQFMEPYRLAGNDLEVDGPRFVAIELEIHVRVAPGYFQSDIRAAILEVFGSGVRPDGQRGVFHPDNFTFGQPVYLSPIYAAAQAIPGVSSLQVTVFRRQGQGSPGRAASGRVLLDPVRAKLDLSRFRRPISQAEDALRKGRLDLGRLEIARLDNDPDFPERGVLRVVLEGGK